MTIYRYADYATCRLVHTLHDIILHHLDILTVLVTFVWWTNCRNILKIVEASLILKKMTVKDRGLLFKT